MKFRLLRPCDSISIPQEIYATNLKHTFPVPDLPVDPPVQQKILFAHIGPRAGPHPNFFFTLLRGGMFWMFFKVKKWAAHN